MKKLLLLFAVLLTTLGASAYDFEVDGIYYNVLSSAAKTCEVTKGDNKYTGVVVIPASVTYSGRTYWVTTIGNYAFYNCKSLTSVEIPNSVTTIGSGAFSNCTGLTSVEIPNSVTSIENNTFFSCIKLKSVVIPKSVTKIGGWAFYWCPSLLSVEIPNSVTTIGERAFCLCEGLTSVVIGNSVTTIGERAFGECKRLIIVVIGKSVTEIGKGEGAFALCNNLTQIISLNTTPPTIYLDTFKKVDNYNCVIKVPAEAVSAYNQANFWRSFRYIIPLTDEEMAQLDDVESVLGEAEVDAREYTLDGRAARKGQRGIVVVNGRKVIR